MKPYHYLAVFFLGVLLGGIGMYYVMALSGEDQMTRMKGWLSIQASITQSADDELHDPGFMTQTYLADPEMIIAIPKKHRRTPRSVKAVYVPQCIARSIEQRNKLMDLAQETEINALVIDLKDYSGTFSPRPSVHALRGGSGCTIPDFEEFVQELHDHGIYVIGRMTVFQDPLYSSTYPEQAIGSIASPGIPWRDYAGLSYVDVGARPFWKYIVSLSEEAFHFGVDEINFDYVRYPSDGVLSDMSFPYSNGSKSETLEQFFAYISQELRKVEIDGVRPVLSVDLFGLTTTARSDLNIGQILEKAMPYFDYIAPMVYPSHYPQGFNGWENPNHHVHDVVLVAMEKAVERAEAFFHDSPTGSREDGFLYTPTTEDFETLIEGVETQSTKKRSPRFIMRPWIQDFDYGGNYGSEEVRAQIQAVYDAGLDSWMIWSPVARYTRGALESEPYSF